VQLVVSLPVPQTQRWECFRGRSGRSKIYGQPVTWL
jgi:hypothetical protein